MPDNVLDVIEQLQRDNATLMRTIGGDSMSRQTGIVERLEQIQTTLRQMQQGMYRLWIAISISIGILFMVIVQLLWHGMNS